MFNVKGNYPYPVLLEETRYFKNSYIHAEYFKSSSKNAHKIRIVCELNNDEITQFIQEGKAVYTVQVESPNAFYRKIFQFSNPNIEITISNDEVIDYINIGVAIVATEDIENYTNKDFINEYQDITFSIKKNEILAICDPRNDIEITYEGEVLKEVKNIFKLKKTEEKFMSYNLENERILVFVPKDYLNTYVQYKKLESKDVINILNTTIFLPILTNVIADMGEESNLSKIWYKTLKKKIKEIAEQEKRNVEDCLQEPLETAQKLLKYPMIDVIASLRDIMEGME